MEQNQNYSQLLEQYSQNVIASNTDLKGIITYVSKAFCTISGFSESELLGKNHNVVRHPDMSNDFFETLWNTIQNGQTFSGEIKNRKKDGGFYWVEVVIAPLYSDNNEHIGYSAIRHDITQKKEFEALNKKHENLLTQFSKYVIASKTDLTGNITYVSDAFCDISGYKKEELLGQNHNIVRHPDMPSRVFEELWQTIQSGDTFFGEFKNKKQNGDYYWVEVAVSPDYGENNEIIGYSAIRHNISQRKIVEELMIVDALTKIKNRQYYDKCIEKEIDMVKRYGTKMSLMLIDIDYFKKINDSYGHDVGDSVLVEFSRLVEKSIRKCDTFCRIGGEEFVIISPNITKEQNYLFSNKIISLIANHKFHIANEVTVSIGVASCCQEDDKTSLFKRADEALYESKERGRNRVTVTE